MVNRIASAPRLAIAAMAIGLSVSLIGVAGGMRPYPATGGFRDTAPPQSHPATPPIGLKLHPIGPTGPT